MAVSLKDIVLAIAAAIEGMGDIQCRGFILAQPTPGRGYAQIVPGGDAGDIEYDQAMGRGLDGCPLTLTVIAGSPTDIGSQTRMFEYLDPGSGRSIKEVIEADRTLGGLVDDIRVRACTGWRQRTVADQPAQLAASWYIDVMATIG